MIGPWGKNMTLMKEVSNYQWAEDFKNITNGNDTIKIQKPDWYRFIVEEEFESYAVLAFYVINWLDHIIDVILFKNKK